MHQTWLTGTICALSAVAAAANEPSTRFEDNWHQWRGPLANGVAPHGDPPVTWNASTGIKWKTAIPGEGSSTPILWQNRLYLLTAIKTDRVAEQPPRADERAKTQPPANYYQFVVICLDRETGQELWRQVACEAVPHEGRHFTNSYASGSPTTDGQRLYAFFGSRGLFCFDLEGQPLWQRDFGDMRTRYGWGEGTSPVVHGGSIAVNWDQEENSFIDVLDSATGETKWHAERDEPTSWATPLVVEYGGRTQLIVNATHRVRSYDLETGEIIWECGGQTVNVIPSPIVVGDVVFCMSGYQSAVAYAIRLDAKGDLTDTDQPLWIHRQGTPYVPSPLAYGGQIYFTAQNTSVLTCLDMATGKPIFERQRLPGLGNVYASPVAAADRIYFTDRDGKTVVLKHGPQLEVLATNDLGEPIDASPIIVGKQLFLRSASHVYCVE